MIVNLTVTIINVFIVYDISRERVHNTYNRVTVGLNKTYIRCPTDRITLNDKKKLIIA